MSGIAADRSFRYADASQGDDTFTIEYCEDGPEVFRGVYVEPGELGVEDPWDDGSSGGFADA